jgi:hypothetical protein
MFQVAFLVGIFSLLTSIALAEDPQCVGAVTPPSLDLTGGSVKICIPDEREDSSAIPADKSIDCNVTFFDGSGAQLDSVDVSGLPNDGIVVAVPMDGTGTAVGNCTEDGATGTSETVAVTFPPLSPPNGPVMLEN